MNFLRTRGPTESEEQALREQTGIRRSGSFVRVRPPDRVLDSPALFSSPSRPESMGDYANGSRERSRSPAGRAAGGELVSADGPAAWATCGARGVEAAA